MNNIIIVDNKILEHFGILYYQNCGTVCDTTTMV
jgi:hypothetical protein